MFSSVKYSQDRLKTKTVLMFTPFYQMQRGNSRTVARIKKGLLEQGFSIEVLAMEQPGWLSRLEEAVSARRYALIHGFHGLYFGQTLEKIPGLKELPLLLTTTGTDLNIDLKGPQRPVVIQALAAAQKIIVFNPDLGQFVAEAAPGLAEKLVTIPQGVYLEGKQPYTRSELDLRGDEVVFLLPSGLRPVKNLELAINALEKVHPEFPALRLVIIGAVIDPAYAEQIQNRVQSLPWLTYLGEMPHQSMPGILALGDIVLNTSDSEGQPQGALEAMSLAKPALMTAVPGNLNLITDGVEGFYVRDEADLIRGARILLEDPVLRKNMGAAAQKLVQKQFAVENEWAAYAKLYRELLS